MLVTKQKSDLHSIVNAYNLREVMHYNIITKLCFCISFSKYAKIFFIVTDIYIYLCDSKFLTESH